MTEPPAFRAFDRDDRVRTNHLRVYRHCRELLDFREPRDGKLDAIASALGRDKSNVSRTLADLIAWGYLREAGRDQYGNRALVLVWSVAQNATTGQADAA